VIDYDKYSGIIDDNQLPSMVFQHDRFLVHYGSNLYSILLTQPCIPHPEFPLIVRGTYSIVDLVYNRNLLLIRSLFYYSIDSRNRI